MAQRGYKGVERRHASWQKAPIGQGTARADQHALFCFQFFWFCRASIRCSLISPKERSCLSALADICFRRGIHLTQLNAATIDKGIQKISDRSRMNGSHISVCWRSRLYVPTTHTIENCRAWPPKQVAKQSLYALELYLNWAKMRGHSLQHPLLHRQELVELSGYP